MAFPTTVTSDESDLMKERFLLVLNLEGVVYHGREGMVAGVGQFMVFRVYSVLYGIYQEAECSSQKPGYPFQGPFLVTYTRQLGSMSQRFHKTVPPARDLSVQTQACRNIQTVTCYKVLKKALLWK